MRTGMERTRHRKSKSASGIQGTQLVRKQRAVPRQSSASDCYIEGSSRDDMFMLGLGQNSLGPVTGIPMKKLLAEEMSKEVESKRHSPSVIARLMGLERMPSSSPHHVCRQQKRFLDSHQKKNISVNLQKSSPLHDDQLSRKGSIVQREFKDIYKDREASHVVDRSCSSRWSASSTLTKPKMALIRKMFVDAKHLSTSEKLQDSKEMDHTLEMLDSNRDLLLKLLGQPGSLFVNHEHDPHVGSGSSVGSRIAVLRPSNSVKYESKAKAWRSREDTLNKRYSTSCLKHEDGQPLEPHRCYRTRISQCSSRFQVYDRNEEMLPTEVVILKPNLVKMQNPNASGWSPGLPHGYPLSCRKNKAYQRVGGAEKLLQTRKKSLSFGFSMPISEEVREISREIMTRVRNGCDATGKVDTRSTGFRGYLGDESSCDANETDSESEFEVFDSSSRNSFHDTSCLGESSVSKEARKRLRERWKVTHKYQDLEMVSQSSTLGDMLVLPDRESGSHHLNAKTSCVRQSDRLGCYCNSGSVTWDGLLGISSRDGWRDGAINNLSRSRSLPPSKAGRRPRRSKYHTGLTKDNPMLHGGPVSRAVKGNQKSQSKTRRSCQHMFIHKIDSSSEANLEIQMEANTKGLSDEQFILWTASEDNICKSPVFDAMMIVEPDTPTLPLKSSDLLPKQFSSMVDGEEFSVHDQDDSSLQELPERTPTQGSPSMQCLGTEPDPSEISKETDHASPVSVLEVPYVEDTSSSSESFERVSAELHELRMQLQLLKMEADDCNDKPTLVPIDEQQSLTFPKGDLMITAEGWETSYTNDVLMNSGFQESDLNAVLATWHSPNSPLDPKLFDNLEKKYGYNETNGMRSDRRLLFDRINSAILEHFDPCPWIMPRLGGLNLKVKDGVGDALDRSMKQEFTEGEKWGREVQWSVSKDEIEAVGNEIEKLLVDAMIAEVVH